MTGGAPGRLFGFVMLTFGVTGVVLVIAAGSLVLGSLQAVDEAATQFERQRVEIVALLGPASSALSEAATSASNASASLAGTSDAADQAAALTKRLAESFEGLASLGSFEVLGLHPFGQLSGQFGAVGAEARALSTDLTATAVATRVNIADSEAVAADMRALAAQLDRLEASLAAPSVGPGGPDPASLDTALPLESARIVLLGLLAWFAVLALGIAWLGLRIALGSRPRA